MRFLSQVYTIARGSVGGITYTANQWHQLIARARTSPVQPNTPHQTGIRSAFDGADDDWRVSAPANKDDWLFYANTVTYSGPLGDYTIPGRQLFVGTLALVKYATALPDSPAILESLEAPVIAGRFNPGIVSVGIYGGLTNGISIDVTNPGDEAGIVVIDVSIAFNPSRNRYKGPWISSAKLVDVLPAGVSSHFEIDRPPGTVGKVIFSRIRMFTAVISPADPVPHRLSALFFLRHISDAPPPPATLKRKKGKPSAEN